ncbi:PfkB family carbohydrate kinase [Candidatus Marinimicrobia bacterium]|nr:PfkB family carbohydrate kinase [Candidatus Neomarinimicrobiota bacterium]
MNEINEVLILGSIALDTIETKFGKKENLLGGSATYATIGAGLYGSPIPIGIVGDDFPEKGDEIFNNFSSNLENIEKKHGKTFSWGGKYHNNGDDRDTLFTDLGVFESFEPVLNSKNVKASWVFLANIHPSLQLSVLNQCKNNPTVITDTMNLWIDTTLQELKKIIKRTDILLINESELSLLTKNENILESSKQVLSMGPQKIVVKLGSKGARCISKNEDISVGVYPVKDVVDPTGAGDVFGGGFVSGLIDKLSTSESMLRGSALASFCIEEFGVSKLININKNDVEKRMESIK